MKNPLTPAGIEPATCGFIAQHLKHCATAVPHAETCISSICVTNSILRFVFHYILLSALVGRHREFNNTHGVICMKFVKEL